MSMKIDEARRLIEQNGIDFAQTLFRTSFDAAIGAAINEEFERRVDSFNKHQREIMHSFSAPPPSAK